MSASLPPRPTPLPARFSRAIHCELEGFNIFRALCPGHLQLASGYTVGLRGGTLKCLRFRHICRQDVCVGLGAQWDGGRRRLRGGGEFLSVLLMSCDNEQHPLTPSQDCSWIGAARAGAPIKCSFLIGWRDACMLSAENQMWQVPCVCVQSSIPSTGREGS